jgi:hypothetical protein
VDFVPNNSFLNVFSLTFKKKIVLTNPIDDQTNGGNAQ